eukprot:TRINITY_DN68053_c0_g1_i1.p1 TRINITY_DN68053_c0_g1~~TRINITY_DN68053_c0_g1_i1.p1  ORF type:complete len:159 (+),score=30.44 TRINITY_DN68053_c0_g1_i1:62-478(+)
MPPSGGGKRGGRGREGGGPGRGGDMRVPGGAGYQEGKKGGGGRGSDYQAAPLKFNAQEASEWIAGRFQVVMDEYEKQKGSGKKGDIQNFSDMNSDRPAWGSGAKPVLPGKEDFLQQLQSALMQFRGRQTEEGKGAGGS